MGDVQRVSLRRRVIAVLSAGVVFGVLQALLAVLDRDESVGQAAGPAAVAGVLFAVGWGALMWAVSWRTSRRLTSSTELALTAVLPLLLGAGGAYLWTQGDRWAGALGGVAAVLVVVVGIAERRGWTPPGR
ncbi:hypothetical protein [Nocardioides zeicaulis]|uniref:EamA family transporter n=1 Tax=Nocardioides zeicaulis TaxID=1776857 RepID=A0ABV6DY04_9ACTN